MSSLASRTTIEDSKKENADSQKVHRMLVIRKLPNKWFFVYASLMCSFAISAGFMSRFDTLHPNKPHWLVTFSFFFSIAVILVGIRYRCVFDFETKTLTTKNGFFFWFRTRIKQLGDLQRIEIHPFDSQSKAPLGKARDLQIAALRHRLFTVKIVGAEGCEEILRSGNFQQVNNILQKISSHIELPILDCRKDPHRAFSFPEFDSPQFALQGNLTPDRPQDTKVTIFSTPQELRVTIPPSPRYRQDWFGIFLFTGVLALILGVPFLIATFRYWSEFQFYSIGVQWTIWGYLGTLVFCAATIGIIRYSQGIYGTTIRIHKGRMLHGWGYRIKMQDIRDIHVVSKTETFGTNPLAFLMIVTKKREYMVAVDQRFEDLAWIRALILDHLDE